MVGPATNEKVKGKGVEVLFPGNNPSAALDCGLNQVRRRRRHHAATPAAVPTTPAAQPPPLSPSHILRVPCVGAQVSRQQPPSLPGGYTVGEHVYFTGTSETLEDGDRVEHGMQGEVVGPAIGRLFDRLRHGRESHKGKAVTVLFPGNSFPIQCRLNQVWQPPRWWGPPPVFSALGAR